MKYNTATRVRADARAEHRSAQQITGAFGQRWNERDNPAQGLIFNPYVARSGELKVCRRLTAALLRKGEAVEDLSIRQVRKKEGKWDFIVN